MTANRAIKHIIFWTLNVGLFVVFPILNHMHWAALYAAHGVR